MTTRDLLEAIEPGWRRALASEFDKPYMKNLAGFLDKQAAAHKTIYPQREDLFAALNETPLKKVKVVILGQDPYHGPGQAHGLSFSVPPGVRLPPSLRNIFKELKSDLGIDAPKSGNLIDWAHQGVLLLNAVLSVEAGRAASHEGKGWEAFTDHILSYLSETKSGLVFVLWGSYAQKKAQLIDESKHLVLQSPHPSPLSARRGFFGSKPFSQINAYLETHGKTSIDWHLLH